MGYFVTLCFSGLLALAIAEDYVCPSGKSKATISIGTGDSYTFTTQEGAEYLPKTDCTVKYVKQRSCKKVQLSCDSFAMAKGDVLLVRAGKQRYKFNGNNFESVVSGVRSTIVRFRSNKKVNGAGAVCTVACMDTTTTTPAPTTNTTTGSGGSEGGSGSGSGGAGSQEDYCAIASDHTMCLHTGPSDACTAKTELRTMSDAAKELIVAKHNELRAKVARGEETNGPQPKASNMRKLVWNDELAVIAQRWADQCQFEHDTSRQKADGTWVGQNLYLHGSSNQYEYEELMSSIPTDSSLGWYNEVVSPGFEPSNVDPFVFSHDAGHYTQVVWAETEEIGCGWTYFKEQVGPFLAYKQLMVCNYAEGGNDVGAPMYKIGEPCSACDEGFTCENDLCVRQS